jgi:hypothetical protein
VNNGIGAFILTSATVTGDFQITQNSCSNPVPLRGFCGITINFSPTAVGLRTGVLTLTDNLTPTVQTIQLSGNGVTTAPAPTIGEILAIPVGNSGTGALVLAGTGFFPNSTVSWNGQPRTTHYEGEGALAADLLPADMQQPGEGQVVVSTPAPGGGTSAASTATVYGRLQNLQIVNEVFEPHSQLIYATTSKTSQTNPNSVVAIDPVAMKVVNTVLTGNGPNSIAVSDDGSMLYVGLDDKLSVTQISLPGGTQNFTVKLPSVAPNSVPAFVYSDIVAAGLKVVPGQPHTWVVGLCESSGEPCGLGVAVFDDTTVRPIQENDLQLTANSFVFVNDPTVVYSTEFNQSPPDISAYKISPSGIQRTAISPFLPAVGGSPLQSDGSLIYDSAGQVIDPSTLVTRFTYPQAGVGLFPQPNGGFTLDTPNKRLYFAGAPPLSEAVFPGRLLLSAVGQATMITIGQIVFPEASNATGVERFGTNGLAINQGNQWLFVQTSLTGTAIPVPAVTVSPASLSFGMQTQGMTAAARTITVANTGTAAVSLSGISVSGDYNETNNCGTSLAVSASCVISVSFTPTAPGDRAGQLTIADNATGNPQSVPLDGTGTAPAPVVSASLSPASLSFGAQAQGTTSAAQKVTLANTGTAALSISGISATGDYSEIDNCGTSLAVSASCIISVSFTPAATGDRAGQLMIGDDAAGSPQSVSLDGTGTATAPPFTLAPQSSGGNTATVASGGTVTYNLRLITTTYAGVVKLSCTGAPAPATCSINPAAPNVTAGAPTPFVVTVTTVSSNSSAMLGDPPSKPVDERRQILSAGLGLMTLLIFPLLFSIRRSRSSFLGLMLLGLAISFGLAGCASGSPAKSGSQANVAPAGTYQLTITAAADSQSTSEVLTLTVQ